MPIACDTVTTEFQEPSTYGMPISLPNMECYNAFGYYQTQWQSWPYLRNDFDTRWGEAEPEPCGYDSGSNDLPMH